MMMLWHAANNAQERVSNLLGSLFGQSAISMSPGAAVDAVSFFAFFRFLTSSHFTFKTLFG